MTLVIVLPAAGASTRMGGRDKLMEDVEGAPLLLRQTRRALATGADVLVTARADAPARIAALEGSGARMIPVADPSEGIAASIRAGVAALSPGTTALMIVLPDLPDIDTSDMLGIMAAHRAAPTRILRAVAADGTPGHPTLFPAEYFPRLGRIEGDSGAARLIAGAGFDSVRLEGARAITDLDTPAAWAAWRARNM